MQVWRTIHHWISGVPQRNQLLLLGDFNCTLMPQPPHVGTGVTDTSTAPHQDADEFQRIVCQHGLTALNTWSRGGRAASTFLRPAGVGAQLDYAITRLPCHPSNLQTKGQSDASIVHPTGFRHIPLIGSITRSKPPRNPPRSPVLQASQAQRMLRADPHLASTFHTAVAEQVHAESDLNSALLHAWYTTTPPALPPTSGEHNRHLQHPRLDGATQATLKQFWNAKRALRQALDDTDHYSGPVILHVAECGMSAVRNSFPRALVRVGAPSDLASAIMYVHDSASIVLERHGLYETVPLASGIRQGCGLSPLLWLAFTLILYDDLLPICPADAITCFADDFHVQWNLAHPRDFRNACQQILRIFEVFENHGMTIATDKTVVLMAMKGPEVPKLLQEFVQRRGPDRLLVLPRTVGSLLIPIKTSHKYLGVHIGYGKFERVTLTARLRLSWIAFGRLRTFLKHPGLPVTRRLSLWRTYVWAILQYGLTSVGLDAWSVDKLRSQVAKQIRLVVRSPAHVSHETTAQLFARLKIPDPMTTLAEACKRRITVSAQALHHLQPEQVKHWWALLESTFSIASPTDQSEAVAPRVRLREITQVANFRCACPECGQYFPTSHALSVHIGKQHAAIRPRKARNTREKQVRCEEYRQHSERGMPQCRHCHRQFYGWLQFRGASAPGDCNANSTPRPPEDRPVSMASADKNSQELKEAATELERFAEYMRPQTGEPSTAPSSARASNESAELIPAPDSGLLKMDVDREKRLADPQPEPATTKWPKGHAKGDNKGEGQTEEPEPDKTLEPDATGKGRAPSPRRALQRRSEPEPVGSQGRRGPQQRQNWWGQQQRRSHDRNERGTRQNWCDQGRDSGRETAALQELVAAMGRLTLRIEDSINVYNLDTSFMLFLQTKESEKGWTVTKELFTVAKEWNRQKSENAAALNQPMRTVLFHCLLSALKTRLRSMESDTEMCLKAKEMGLTDGTHYLYLKWNQQDHRYERDAQEPLAHEKAVEIVDYLVQLTSFPDTIGKFHPLRKLTQTMESEVIPFSLHIQNRTQEAHQMYCLMRRLCRNGCLHLVGATARPTRLGRSPLAVHVDQLLQSINGR
ncbi:hypothetical protein AK812_SmicGene21348 [Symbiodinium microadriaticum]|uniref:C2H2-type domain-containing protein n=1 Tax=Symbiodinium microadriaticum TaxID=2951 RepID=A0A1Q9DMN4_SYMMI|nr:hypothetical protein AK812_SmicGene21348 [Symbiodinium microadriaticum]